MLKDQKVVDEALRALNFRQTLIQNSQFSSVRNNLITDLALNKSSQRKQKDEKTTVLNIKNKMNKFVRGGSMILKSEEKEAADV